MGQKLGSNKVDPSYEYDVSVAFNIPNLFLFDIEDDTIKTTKKSIVSSN
jgi:hypothetical protein